MNVIVRSGERVVLRGNCGESGRMGRPCWESLRTKVQHNACAVEIGKGQCAVGEREEKTCVDEEEKTTTKYVLKPPHPELTGKKASNPLFQSPHCITA